MDVVGSEIGQKMRSAIKAKLTELGCYVDDELPDYVMVMVANKRTRAQMEDDLQLFLGDNTELFVNWLHQVLKKLQEVTVTAPPPKLIERDKSKERSVSKERKSKEKKLKIKPKKSDLKKAKKKEKSKTQKKKEEKKSHKKKKSKHHEMIRPNIPPLLMNIEKESEPSITDVFAGQILKNHGVLLDPTPTEEPKETKPEIKRPIIPIIDPATILSEPTNDTNKSKSPTQAPKEDQIKEINEIEAKIQGLKAKLAEQLDSMSDDEDFLNIRTEAEELMNDFAEDVFQEISSQTSQQTTVVATPPIPAPRQKSLSPSLSLSVNIDSPETLESPKHEPIKEKEVIETPPIEVLPQIELNLPKRPVRERLGVLETKKTAEKQVSKVTESPERYTPEREPEIKTTKTAKSRLGAAVEPQRKLAADDGTEINELSSKRERITSKISSVLESRKSRVKCASVVRVRPRPRVNAPASSLLLRAVADAHKSLLNIPPKIEPSHKVQRALVLPMRRSVEAQKIVIQVPGRDTVADDGENDAISLGDPDSEDDKTFKLTNNEKEEYVPAPITKKFINTDYKPPRSNESRTTSIKDDSIIIETLNIHSPTVGKDKNTQFIVTMDGYHPNAFLAKKLQTEGLLEDETTDNKATSPKKPDVTEPEKPLETKDNSDVQKRLSNTSEESETQVSIKKEPETISGSIKSTEKRKTIELSAKEEVPVKKRKSSPIVFDVDKKEKAKERERERQRTESAGSDNHVVVTTKTDSHKYDSLPPLSKVSAAVAAPIKPASASASLWCRAFPHCRYGASCAFQHPRCKFAAACTRRNCLYSHGAAPITPTTPAILHTPSPLVASQVVPAANYKTISATLPAMCKFYPACVNPACHFYHPKPCRYGKNCTNKLDCNFYHAEFPNKWFPV